MKRLRTALILILVAAVIFTAGCTGGKQDDRNEKPNFEEGSVRTTMLHGNPQGLWFMLATGVSECLNKSFDGSLMEVSPGHNYSNLYRLDEHTSDFGLTHTTIAYEAIQGNETFEEALVNVGGINVFYPSMAQLIINRDVGITTLDELFEKKIPIKITIGDSGGNAVLAFWRVIAEYGVTVEDMEGWGCKIYEKGHKDAVDMYSDGVIQGVWTVAGAPTPALTQISTNGDVMIPTFSEELIKTMHEKYGYNPYTLPGGSYPFDDQDIKSFTTYTMLAASLETSEETAYKVTRSIHENLDYLRAIHSALADLSPESLLEGMSIPLHPGAEKYYREVGLID